MNIWDKTPCSGTLNLFDVVGNGLKGVIHPPKDFLLNHMQWLLATPDTHLYKSHSQLFIFLDPHRETERQLVSVNNIVIGGLPALNITPQAPPPNLQPIREVKLDDECITVAAYKSAVFVGTDAGKIQKVDKFGSVWVVGEIQN